MGIGKAFLIALIFFGVIIIITFWGDSIASFFRHLFHFFGGAVDELSDEISSESGHKKSYNKQSKTEISGARILAALILFAILIEIFYYIAPETFMPIISSISEKFSKN